MSELHINRDQFLDLQKIGIGAFAPLTGFMNEDDFESVVTTMRLRNGGFISLPVYLDVTAEQAAQLRGRPSATLYFAGEPVGEIDPQSIFHINPEQVAQSVFGTRTLDHPGVAKLHQAGNWMVGGPVTLHDAGRKFLFAEERTPDETRRAFAQKGWKTVAGFQTRNVPHRAHEYLQRIAMELCDGLFVQPLVGRKKVGDYTAEAILAAYRTLIGDFFPADRAMLGVLSTSMRYAGPREAVFHALIRRNYGCTHFIMGRDQAGVGSFYGKYAAQELAKAHAGELNIEILALCGPFHCQICDGIVTEKTCSHGATKPEAVTEVSGTLMRQLLRESVRPRPELMRPEVIGALSGIPLFVENEDNATNEDRRDDRAGQLR